MNALTLNQIQNEEKLQGLTCGRRLHQILGSSREFATWIKDRIKKCGFIEGKDFSTKLSKSGGRPSKEYQLTHECAIIIAAKENTQKGIEFIKFFTERQSDDVKKLHEKIIQLEQSKYHLTGLLSETNKELYSLKEENIVLKTIDLSNKNRFSLQDLAEKLEICRNKMCERLRALGYLEYNFSRKNVATKQSWDLGLIFNEQCYENRALRNQAIVTRNGMQYFKKRQFEYFGDLLNEDIKRLTKPALTNLNAKYKKQLLIGS